MTNLAIAEQYVEVVGIIRALKLDYPIATQQEFVAYISSSCEVITFRGIAYDARFAANLLPPFYFPITSEQDLVGKAIELMMARGLVPMKRI